ncbi:uncharacterized protein [Littorina saxatilis]|uniref:Uncharacterized protein n=1 Tax=Littorina saxatilis TaxID=31220 RepID=A0AAN9GF76_9CAEN
MLFTFFTGANFKFLPEIQNSTHAVKEGSQLNLIFELNTENCTHLFNSSDSYTITVSKQDKRDSIDTDVCKMMVYSNGTCFLFRPLECQCVEQKGRYALSKTMHESDATLWKWKTNDNMIANETKLNITIKGDSTGGPSDIHATQLPATTPYGFRSEETTLPANAFTPEIPSGSTDKSTNVKNTGSDAAEAAAAVIVGVVIAVVGLVVIIGVVVVVRHVGRKRTCVSRP